MILFLTTVDQQGQNRRFSCHIDKLEEGLDFLSNLVAVGETLVKASVMDDSRAIDLPVAAFDGMPYSPFIGELEAEWKAILNKPLLTSLATQEVAEHNQVLLAQCEMRIVRLELLITQIDELRQRAKIYKHIGVHLKGRYQSILSSYHRQLTHAYSLREQFLKHLHHLWGS